MPEFLQAELIHHHVFPCLHSKFITAVCRLVCNDWNRIFSTYPLRFNIAQIKRKIDFVNNYGKGNLNQIVHLKGDIESLCGVNHIKSLTSLGIVIPENYLFHLYQNCYFSELKNLKELSFYGNNTTVPVRVFEFIKNLEHLNQLQLFHCDLYDETCWMIGNLPNLKKLLIGGGICSNKSIAKLMNLKLETLILISVSLASKKLSNFNGMTTLKHLEIPNNNIDDTIEDTLSNLTQLEYLDLDNNELTGQCFKYSTKLRNLKTLKASKNRITNQKALEYISEIRSLTYLDLSFNKFGAKAKVLSKLTNLTELHLENCYIIEGGLSGFSNLLNVKNLNLEICRLADSDFEELSHLKLNILNLVRCGLKTDSVKHIGNIKTLKVLSLQKNDIFDEGVSHLVNLTNLEQLSLSKTKITDSGLVYLQQLKKLRIIGLAYNSLGNESLSILSNVENLRFLNMTKTEIDKESIPLFSHLKSLAKVVLFETKYSEEDIVKLKEVYPELYVFTDDKNNI